MEKLVFCNYVNSFFVFILSLCLMCFVLCGSRWELSSLCCELQRERPQLLAFLEDILGHTVAHLQDTSKERDNLEQALHRLPPVLDLYLRLQSVVQGPSVPNVFDHSVFFSLGERVNTIALLNPYMKKWKIS